MKDVPHHLEKFLKQMAKHESAFGEEELKKAQKLPISEKQIKKQKKLKQKEDKENRTNPHPTLDEQNLKLKKRTPLFRKRSRKTPLK